MRGIGAAVLIVTAGTGVALLVHLGMFRRGGPPGWDGAPGWLQRARAVGLPAAVALLCALAGLLALGVLEGTSLLFDGRPAALMGWAVGGSTVMAIAGFTALRRR